MCGAVLVFSLMCGGCLGSEVYSLSYDAPSLLPTRSSPSWLLHSATSLVSTAPSSFALLQSVHTVCVNLVSPRLFFILNFNRLAMKRICLITYLHDLTFLFAKQTLTYRWSVKY